MLDLLSHILTNLSMQGTLYFRTSFSKPWGVAVPNYENVARFHFAHRGGCLVHVDGTDTIVDLAQGDLVIIPHGTPHSLYCGHEPERTILPLDVVLEKSGYDGSGVLVYGGEEPQSETQLVCGHFSFDPSSRHILLDRLPPYIHLKNYGESAGRWMEAQEQEQFERYTIPVVAPGPEWFSRKVTGPSMTEAGFSDGCFAVCQPLTPRIPTAADGDFVAVERIRPDGLREVTLKQYVVHDDGTVELWPRSADPRYQSPLPFDDGPDGTEVRIIGIVRGRYEAI